MCLKSKKVTSPDTSVQEAEAARQRLIEEARYNDRIAAEQARYNTQRGDEERRYQGQLAAQLAEAERQRQGRMAEQARQDEAARALEGRREQERQEQLAQVQARATASRNYADGRQKLITDAESSIKGAYAGFDDAFYQDFAKAFVQQNAPELERQASAKGRQTKFAAARKGNLASTATARAFGDLTREKGAAQAQLAQQGQNTANGFRDSVETQKRDALSTLWSAGGVGAASLPDGMTDANTALGGIGAQLNSLTATARNNAATMRVPF